MVATAGVAGVAVLVVHFHAPAPPSELARGSTVASASSPTLIETCLQGGGFTAAGSTPSASDITPELAVSIARGAHAFLSGAPSQTEFVQVGKPPGQPSDDAVSQSITHPLWAVAFTGLHVQDLGGSAIHPQTRVMTGVVVLVDSRTQQWVMAVHCDVPG